MRSKNLSCSNLWTDLTPIAETYGPRQCNSPFSLNDGITVGPKTPFMIPIDGAPLTKTPFRVLPVSKATTPWPWASPDALICPVYG